MVAENYFVLKLKRKSIWLLYKETTAQINHCAIFFSFFFNFSKNGKWNECSNDLSFHVLMQRNYSKAKLLQQSDSSFFSFPICFQSQTLKRLKKKNEKAKLNFAFFTKNFLGANWHWYFAVFVFSSFLNCETSNLLYIFQFCAVISHFARWFVQSHMHIFSSFVVLLHNAVKWLCAFT